MERNRITFRDERGRAAGYGYSMGICIRLFENDV